METSHEWRGCDTIEYVVYGGLCVFSFVAAKFPSTYEFRLLISLLTAYISILSSTDGKRMSSFTRSSSESKTPISPYYLDIPSQDDTTIESIQLTIIGDDVVLVQLSATGKLSGTLIAQKKDQKEWEEIGVIWPDRFAPVAIERSKGDESLLETEGVYQRPKVQRFWAGEL